MIVDNPAARLLKILELGKTYNVEANCKNSWKQLLAVQGDSNSELMSKLGKVMDLPQEAISLLEILGEGDIDMHAHWVDQVSRGFMEQNLNSKWQTFINHIDDHSIRYLKMCARVLDVQSKESLLSAEQLGEIRAEIMEVLNTVRGSSLEISIKQFLIRKLHQILVAIDEYDITGSVPIFTAIESTYGHAVSNPNFRRSIQDSELAETLWGSLNKVSTVISLATGLPELASAGAILLASVSAA
ncbi:hypothetical protein [Vibrio metschnikovii]|uniref:hypothetical protein n=1 Tax=Vibrio metschnikovii TaxID=28172 RepID=UPI001C2FC3ED|nr:hypothetical protein [Vibrio metschnikovii]MDA3140235.1 hypothetical protein [Vibrio metschnikovii]